MKKIKFIILAILFLGVSACSDDDNGSVEFVKDINAPQNINAVFQITQDNTGTVTITPTAEG
ncbi:MAG: PKD domain protein, partial [Flavobacteriaceae bacterium]|nr:PKD domain protein [Flavobacteriaceae bacterium]